MSRTQYFWMPKAAVAMMLAAVIALMAGAGSAFAADERIALEGVKGGEQFTAIYYTDSKAADLNVWEFYSKTGKKVSGVTSSKTAVATAKMKSGKKAFRVTLKKAGTTKISYKFKGKKKTITIVSVKYANPVKSLKVGSVQYAGDFAKGDMTVGEKVSGKLVVKAKSGWKFQYAEYYNGSTIKRIALGKKVPASAQYVLVAMQHKKTGAIVFLTINEQ